MYNGERWPREAPSLLRQGRHYDRRRSQRGRRVERLVVVVTAGAAFDGRVHVVAEKRPGAPDVDAEREERRDDLRNGLSTISTVFLLPVSMVVTKVSQSYTLAKIMQEGGRIRRRSISEPLSSVLQAASAGSGCKVEC